MRMADAGPPRVQAPPARFTMISYNICGLRNPMRVAELAVFLSRRQPSLVVIQEPKLDYRSLIPDPKRPTKWLPRTPSTIPKFSKYQGYHFTHPTEPTGIVMYVHETCMAQPLQTPHHSNPYRPTQTRTLAAYMWLSSPLLASPIVVGGIYLHSELIEDDVRKLAEGVSQAQRPPWLAVSCVPLPVFLIGDFNARHQDWDAGVRDSITPPVKGRWVNTHLLAPTAQAIHPSLPRLTLLNTCFTSTRYVVTHTDPDGDTTIDLAITSHAHLVSGMDVLTGEMVGSDHFPLIVTLHSPLSIPVPTAVLMSVPDVDPDPEHKYDDDDERDQDSSVVCTRDLIVRVSTIPNSGYGLFTRRAYKEGDFIEEYTGIVRNEQQKQARYPNDEGMYIAYVKKDMYIDACDPALSSLARYANTAGTYNNAKLAPVHRRGERSKLNMRATRDIQAGEEILIPYGNSFKQGQYTLTPQRTYQTAPAHANPPSHPASGRVRWKVDANEDWSLFQSQLSDSLSPWIRKYSRKAKHITSHAHAPSSSSTHADAAVPAAPVRSLHASMYSDGASRGNPGPASCGGVIYLNKLKPDPSAVPSSPPVNSFGRPLGSMSNNQAEYQGLRIGLETAYAQGITHLTSYVDSQLVCKQIQGLYRLTNPTLMRVHGECKALIAKFRSFRIVHVLRALNSEADAMCNRALDTNTMIDERVDIPVSESGLTPSQQVVFDLQEQQQQQQQQQQQRWDDDDEKEEDITSHMTQAQIDACWKELHDSINNTALSTLGTTTTQQNSKEWWSRVPNIDALHEAFRRTRRRIRTVRRTRAVPVSIAVLVSTQAAYSKAKNDFLTAVRQARSECWYELAAACDNTTEQNKHKLLWSRLKRTMPSSRVPAAAFPDDKGAPPHTPEQALNNMAAHLANVSSLARDPSHDLAHERHVRDYLSTHVPSASDPSESPPWTHDDVVGVCSRFRLNTALGSDNVSPYFLRYGGPTLHQALNLFFSICWRYGVMPSSFRHGHVVTLYKGEGEVNDPNSYRPICITSVVARVYERLQVQNMLNAMSRVNMPSPSQFGFTRQRSTHDAIYRLLSHITETIGAGTEPEDFTSTVFVDISKAYDKVWVEGLLYKIHKMGITGNLYYMLRALLTDRTIQVVGDGKVSIIHILLAGVPQGSILAPFLFLIYKHDICTMPADLRYPICMSLFADDIALVALKSGPLALTSMQRALSSMSDYARKWKITFSAKKTNAVFFKTKEEEYNTGRRGQAGHAYVAVAHSLILSNFSVATARSYKYLGVTLDDRLTMIPHMHETLLKVSRTADLISRLVRRDHLPSFPVIQTLVKCVLIPQMTYGFPFLQFSNKAVSTRQVTGSNSQCTFPMRFKNCIMRPLLYVLGLPRNSHHASVFVESRLHNIHTLLTLTTARLAHRWLSLSDTNEAAVMFRNHITRYGSGNACAAHPKHPFARMCAAVHSTPLCFIGAASPSFFLLPKQSIRTTAWEHQYRLWHKDCISTGMRVPAQSPAAGFHSLIPYYPVKPVDSKVPMYTHYDTPATAAHRARFRFGRARLMLHMHRLKFADANDPVCPHCPAHVDESVEHVLDECAAYKPQRDVCYASLYAVLGRRARCFRSSSLHILALDPEGSVPREHLHRVMEITGKYINQVTATRKC